MRKDGTRKDRKNEGMRTDGTRNKGHEIPGCIGDPISGPRIKGIISNPECFKKTPFCTAINALPRKMPRSLFHSQGLAVLCIRNSGFADQRSRLVCYGSAMSPRTV
ncbi:hypothetical protein TNCV_3651121 [Trichonephila clavipes]|nr:hypothetical protein TNCV_3651121 [Trichonephila clavipes]